MIHRLRELESEGNRLRIGLAGAGAMGRGIAMQVGVTPGMELSWVVDCNDAAAEEAVRLAGTGTVYTSVAEALEADEVNVFVEATNSIAAAADYCLAAIEASADVVLMNAEVDLAVGAALNEAATEAGVVVTSDAGDQHGVLATMIDEAELMGFEIVQAGNIKGFLDEAATPESIRIEAEKRKLSAQQCCAYTDGTKLHIEMAVLANGYGYLPPDGGMKGPRAESVHEALSAFDLDSYNNQARIDYLLGAEPGGGVYLIVKKCDKLPEDQDFLLNYYKLGDGPYYLLYRPYHLCHLETPRAIAQVALDGQAVLSPRHGRLTDVYAYAKRKLKAGELLAEGLGSAEVFGRVQRASTGDAGAQVPICLLEESYEVVEDIEKGQTLTFSNIKVSEGSLFRLWKSQF